MADTAQRSSAAEERSLGGLALAAADRHSGDAMRAPGRPAITYAEFGRAIREIAGGLAALGVEPGDPVAILCGTIPEWTLADFGAFCAGAVVVPVYHTNSPEECEYVLQHSGAKVVLLEDAEQAAKVAAVRPNLPELEHVVVLTGEAPDAITLADLRGRGVENGEQVARERTEAITPDDTATIVYTSGTTGPPKGCVLSHGNLLYTAGAYIERLELRDKPSIMFQYLPLAHVLARMVSFVTIEVGGTLAFWGGDTKNLAADIAEAQPTHIPTVPRLLEKIMTRVISTAEGAGGAKAAIFKRALSTGEKVAKAQREGGSVNPLIKIQAALGHKLALSKVKNALGPNDPVLITGAAPIGAEVIEFFYACGVPVLEGYGMTETCAAATLNTLSEIQVGSVGRPLPGTEVSLGDDGEILMRGPHVFKGYHRNQEATDAIIDDDGWLHSGDLGEIIDGYVRITGRKKDLIITSSGKNVSPEMLESALRETRWISQAIAAGDRRSYLVALVTIDPDEAPKLAAELGVPADPESMATDEKVRERIWEDIDTVNQRFARIEQIKRFAILPHDLSQETGELTPTLKVKRSVVYEKYAGDVDALYEGTPSE
ncbi:long-chain fatty acid--CoA ligase [Solirubrobacter sp. CPCC 204708]|uniref:Acyl-CoA synthetase n=1 Tax=Solirubrobacter deserti TaxID=2282478 RepID=A0ABT4RCD8_9ACTN|nr:long-chain fatty acid--CoA ligase [Solirubrobacter deserti]MBE2315533.1 long-chain fatty acid--CoA ligase [Solirubrobacter deserti]MDA0136171.1 long-chain fatty acid--CoA ligase [Solirubrobacter deserti]